MLHMTILSFVKMILFDECEPHYICCLYTAALAQLHTHCSYHNYVTTTAVIPQRTHTPPTLPKVARCP